MVRSQRLASEARAAAVADAGVADPVASERRFEQERSRLEQERSRLEQERSRLEQQLQQERQQSQQERVRADRLQQRVDELESHARGPQSTPVSQGALPDLAARAVDAGQAKVPEIGLLLELAREYFVWVDRKVVPTNYRAFRWIVNASPPLAIQGRVAFVRGMDAYSRITNRLADHAVPPPADESEMAVFVDLVALHLWVTNGDTRALTFGQIVAVLSAPKAAATWDRRRWDDMARPEFTPSAVTALMIQAMGSADHGHSYTVAHGGTLMAGKRGRVTSGGDDAEGEEPRVHRQGSVATPAAATPGGGRYAERRCFVCGRPGHLAAACPLRQNPRPQPSAEGSPAASQPQRSEGRPEQ